MKFSSKFNVIEKNHECQNQGGTGFSVHTRMQSPQWLGHSPEGSDESNKGGVQPRLRFPAWEFLCCGFGSITSWLRDKPLCSFLPYFLLAASEVKKLKHPHHMGMFPALCVFALSDWGFTYAKCSRELGASINQAILHSHA